MPDVRETLRRMFDEVINNGRLEVADELSPKISSTTVRWVKSGVGRLSRAWWRNGARRSRTFIARWATLSPTVIWPAGSSAPRARTPAMGWAFRQQQGVRDGEREHRPVQWRDRR